MARGTRRPAVEARITARLSTLLTWWEMNRERLNEEGALLENPEFEDALAETAQAIEDDLEDLGAAFEVEPVGELDDVRRRRRGNRPS